VLGKACSKVGARSRIRGGRASGGRDAADVSRIVRRLGCSLLAATTEQCADKGEVAADRGQLSAERVIAGTVPALRAEEDKKRSREDQTQCAPAEAAFRAVSLVRHVRRRHERQSNAELPARCDLRRVRQAIL